MATSSKGRFIVRAEIRSSSETVISYGIELTATSIFVVTEWHAAIGTPVSLRLSFPRILEPIDVNFFVRNLRHKLRLAVLAKFSQREVAQRFHAAEPLRGNQRFKDRLAALAL